MFTNKYNGMESLPLEAVEEVTKHLTPQELSACCAVSVDWRDAFNQDSLWRQHCNKDTAEYLETAECRVEPRFESPESEDSTLSPVCRWRMCYMRETHLRNNWRKWKYVRSEIQSENDISDFNNYVLYIFVSSDFVAFLDDQVVTLWDVRNTPVRLGNPVCLLFNDELYKCHVIDDNIVVIVQSYTVECYSFDTLRDETWRLEYFFFIDGTETYSASDAGKRELKDNGHGEITSGFTIENFLVSITSNESDVLHIWDLRRGNKLRRVQCPEIPKECNNSNWKIVKSEILSTDFVVIAEYERGTSKISVFYVYSLTKLDFLRFRVEHEFNETDIKCVIHDKCLAVADDTQLFIYDYTKSSLVLTLPAPSGCDLLAVGNSILITEEQEIRAMFHTQTLRVEPLTVTNDDDAPLILQLGGHLFGQFFYTFNDRLQPGIWEIGLNSNSTNVTWISDYDYILRFEMNKSHTKLIVESLLDGRSTFSVISFW
ncbi:uncharacterized protein LOC124355382 isoform X1 [Homalodisca vitripennis]|uniref:uncharacterized protein LOC124355382 isoform X1 n=1 Tax=Homalodisca vitripennis TaxID=197043 RepID=UPI001EECAB88|nr:uncharacterized protein LOC124355382 isoform X1 [Homalodisca vitripennis]